VASAAEPPRSQRIDLAPRRRRGRPFARHARADGAPVERPILDPILDPILASWGYGPAFSQALSSFARPDLAPARTISDLGARLEVVDASGVPRLAQLSGRL